MLKAQCPWSIHNEQDCAQELSIGLACKNGSSLPSGFIYHDHTLAAPDTIICETQSDSLCGCWGHEGTGTRDIGCGYCGYNPVTYCTTISGGAPIQYIIVETPLVAEKIVFDYSEADLHRQNTGIPLSSTYCCTTSGSPDQCGGCHCGVVDMQWANSKLFLYGAYQPYYPNCIYTP